MTTFGGGFGGASAISSSPALLSSLSICTPYMKRMFGSWNVSSQHASDHLLSFDTETDPTLTAPNSVRRSCDLCKTNIFSLGVAALWHCRHCDFDVCINCMIREKALPSVHIPVAHNHQLSLHAHDLRGSHQRMTCNSCRQTVSTATKIPVVWSCVGCDYDLCISCYATFAMQNNTSMKECRQAWDCDEKVRVHESLHRCELVRQEPSGSTRASHALTRCDLCGLNTNPTGSVHAPPMFSCAPCNFDACQACIKKQLIAWKTNATMPVIHPPAPAPAPAPAPPPTAPTIPSMRELELRAQVQQLSNEVNRLTALLTAEREKNRAISVPSTTTTTTNAAASTTTTAHHSNVMKIVLGTTEANAIVTRMQGHELDELSEQFVAASELVREEQSRRANCIVCMEKKKAILFMPCKHLCTCATCSSAMTSCPICRNRISERVKVFG